MDIRSYALHVTFDDPSVRLVPMTSRQASVIVVACFVDGLAPCVLIADCEGIGRPASGIPAVGSILEVTEWCSQNLPSDWMAGDGPLWICMTGFTAGTFVLRVRPGSRVSWTKMKWPGEVEGSLPCFVNSMPAYAAPAIRVLDEFLCVR